MTKRHIDPSRVVDQIQAILGTTTELSRVWIDATFDEDMTALERWSDARIRHEYQRWIASLPVNDRG